MSLLGELRSVHLARLLVLVLAGSGALLLFEDRLAVLVELEGSDSAVAGVDWDLGLLTVGLLLYDFLNVNASASAVNGLNLAFATFEVTSQDFDLVTLADGQSTNIILVLKILGEMAGHQNSADTAWGCEVCFS